MTRSTLRRWITAATPAALAVVLSLYAPTSSVAAPRSTQPGASSAPSSETQSHRGNSCDGDSSWGGR
ncbi:hypothetical protein [Streptomyces sp. Z26]|uniref:hypothetical protein n=1 Tax=Streptomyces TaxID=1883 RepID=UPI000FCA43D1|nr:hypothetical protein [Streptomyces sp. Z26]